MEIAKSIQLDEIPQGLYEGYYWYSDKEEPTLIKNEEIKKDWFSLLPFIIEGNFYSKSDQISIQVTNHGEGYHITRFDLSQMQETPKVRIGHRLAGKNLLVIEGWTKQADDNLENFETYQPAWLAFAGFTSKNK